MSDGRLTIRLPSETKAALEAAAAREDLTISQLVRRWVRRELQQKRGK